MFDFFKRITAPEPQLPPMSAVSPVVDFGRMTLDDLKLGEPVPEESPYSDYFRPCESEPGGLTYNNEESGVQIWVEKGIIDCILLTLKDFTGQLVRDGQPLNIQHLSAEADVLQSMGEPYWRDVDEDGEIIGFYEFQFGRMELQFEYPESARLGFITMMTPGLLAQEDQRKAYQVTKLWPPNH